MPLIAFGANKMAEKKAREEAERQQKHAIRSQLASQYGAPSYGADAAKAQYELQRQIDQERRQSNQQLLSDTLDEFSQGEDVSQADIDPDDASSQQTQESRQLKGQEQARKLREQYEIERARRALQGLR